MRKVILVICAVPFFAFAKSVSKCDNSKVVNELQRIAKEVTVDELKKEVQNRDISQVIKKLSFKVRNINSRGYAQQRKANVCEADLSMLVDNNVVETYPVYYSVTSAPKSVLGFSIKMILKE